MKRALETSVEEFLEGVEPGLRRLAEAARKRIRSTVPHATERVRVGWRLIGYNAPAYFAFLTLERDQLRIGFEWGVLLTNHAGLLEGSGRQVRYVAVSSIADLDRPALKALLFEAAALVPPPRPRR